MRAWDIRVDESFFVGGIEKAKVLEVLRPHIFFDDQIAHCEPAAPVVPTALVPPMASSSAHEGSDVPD